jgi:putative heme iron utilization protein
MSNTQLTPEQVNNEVAQFRSQHKTLIIASSSDANEPLTSYAPFVENEGNFYVLLSGLAAHAQNLQQHEAMQRQVSVLLIEDEGQTRNLFARKRLTYTCQVSVWNREHPMWDKVIDQMLEQLGKTIEVLAGLADFKLYQLTPLQGNYVHGFGQAYELKKDALPRLKKN